MRAVLVAEAGTRLRISENLDVTFVRRWEVASRKLHRQRNSRRLDERSDVRRVVADGHGELCLVCDPAQQRTTVSEAKTAHAADSAGQFSKRAGSRDGVRLS